jgi:hypothetical protein
MIFSTFACKNNNKTRFEVGQCVIEKISNYASYVKQKGPIYKIEGRVDDKFKVSIWYNNSWLYQGKRSIGYFKDRKKLIYRGMNCPDGRSKASITDKIKGIDL